MQDPNVQELINQWKDRGRAGGWAKGWAEGWAEGWAKGLAEGRALEARAMLYKVLAVRDLDVTGPARARIDDEGDVARLEVWFEAAVTATSIRDVFRVRSR